MTPKEGHLQYIFAFRQNVWVRNVRFSIRNIPIHIIIKQFFIQKVWILSEYYIAIMIKYFFLRKFSENFKMLFQNVWSYRWNVANGVFACVFIIEIISNPLHFILYLLNCGNFIFPINLILIKCKKALNTVVVWFTTFPEIGKHYLNLPSIILRTRLNTNKSQVY